MDCINAEVGNLLSLCRNATDYHRLQQISSIVWISLKKKFCQTYKEKTYQICARKFFVSNKLFRLDVAVVADDVAVNIIGWRRPSRWSRPATFDRRERLVTLRFRWRRRRRLGRRRRCRPLRLKHRSPCNIDVRPWCHWRPKIVNNPQIKHQTRFCSSANGVYVPLAASVKTKTCKSTRKIFSYWGRNCIVRPSKAGSIKPKIIFGWNKLQRVCS